ncbi:DUF3192 domain-containing protein [Methylomonas koyamae]|uniref:DUF3192 domain-containing protein n=1 Tax=Methylomonas koyamae TaxID=702114 RepID=UPI0009EE6D0F|nr:DUF3192 domain-containing protein [Methylomonas koyamae]
MNKVLMTLFFFFVVACSSKPVHEAELTLSELASLNQGRLARLSIGISKNEVIALMGTDMANTKDGVVNNPWIVEGFVGDDGSNYEVLYYVTRRNPPFTPVLKSITTPVVLKDGKVVSWGNDSVRKRY